MTRYRLHVILFVTPFLTFLVCLRLFYWQILRGESLTSRAASQYDTALALPAQRGEILAADGFPLVSSEPRFLLYAYKPELNLTAEDLSKKLAPLLLPDPGPTTNSAEIVPTKEEQLSQALTYLRSRLNLNRSWVALKHLLTLEQKQAIEFLNLPGLGFDEELTRFYPEASMSAQLLGFVGQDINGRPQGYFGLEGYYDRQLQGRAGLLRQEKDAAGKPILIGNFKEYSPANGRTLITTLNRGYQYQLEKLLPAGIQKYGAKSGSVIVMQPQTGAILAMASFPSYDPRYFYKYDTSLYKNPVVADLFEPGSIFKPLIMAAALNEQVIEPDTTCDICTGPIHIGTYTISTWNSQYHPGTTMTDTLVHSDNTGMVFASRRLGNAKLHDYLNKFGFGQKTGIDLQEEESGVLKPSKDWKEIDLATVSFGQGIAVTPIQMLTAINALANNGQLVSPFVVKTIKVDDQLINNEPPRGKVIIGEKAVADIKAMLVAAVEEGEAKWARPPGIKVAGKTGTAQIPVAGHYDDKKTIASFVGWIPADDPKFTMLVTLREPTSSPWGSETAAPLWFTIAKQLLLLN